MSPEFLAGVTGPKVCTVSRLATVQNKLTFTQKRYDRNHNLICNNNLSLALVSLKVETNFYHKGFI